MLCGIFCHIARSSVSSHKPRERIKAFVPLTVIIRRTPKKTMFPRCDSVLSLAQEELLCRKDAAVGDKKPPRPQDRTPKMAVALLNRDQHDECRVSRAKRNEVSGV